MHCYLYIHIHLRIGTPIVICSNGSALSLFFLSHKIEILIVVVLKHIQWSAWFSVALWINRNIWNITWKYEDNIAYSVLNHKERWFCMHNIQRGQNKTVFSVITMKVYALKLPNLRRLNLTPKGIGTLWPTMVSYWERNSSDI